MSTAEESGSQRRWGTDEPATGVGNGSRGLPNGYSRRSPITWRMAEAVQKGLGELPIYLSGGVFGAATMPERFKRSLARLGRDTQVTTVAPDPIDGVFLIAKESL